MTRVMFFSMFMLCVAVCVATMNNQQDNVCGAEWNTGLDLVHNGSVLQGIQLLDSIRRAGCDEDTFLSSYARSVLNGICPMKKNLPSRVAFTGILPDTIMPSATSWSVITGGKGTYPMFKYGAVFTYRQPRHLTLVLPSMPASQRSRMLACTYSDHIHSLVDDAVDAARIRYDTAFFQMVVDLNNTQVPKDAYLADRINGVYDSLAIGKKAGIFGRLYVQGFSREGIPGYGTTFAAYVVFDCTFRNFFEVPNIKKRVSVNRKARIAMIMHSNRDMQTIAEAKLQKISEAF